MALHKHCTCSVGLVTNEGFYVCSSPQQWTNISTSFGHSVEWPLKRSHHAAIHLSGSLFVIVGGVDQYTRTLYDMWLCDTTTKLWKKVLFLVTVLSVQIKTIKLNQ